MQVGATFVADGETAEAGEPSQRPFHDPAMATQPFAALDATPGNPWCDAASPALTPTTTMVVFLVGVPLVGSAPRAAAPTRAHARYRIERGGQHPAVVAVGPAQRQAERRAPGSTTRWRFMPGLPRSVGFGPVAQPLFLAGRLALSRAARDPSSASAS